MNILKIIIISALFLGIFSVKAQEGFKVKYIQTKSDEVQLDFTLGNYKVDNKRLNSKIYSKIEFQHPITTEKKGYAELPYLHASIELQNNNNVSLEVIPGEFTEYKLDYDLIPSRGVIYRNQDPKKVPYTIDPASITDSWYPQNLVKSTDPYILKDKRGINVYVYPFSYNAKLKTLRVYKTLKVIITENNTPQINPLNNTVNSELIEMRSIYNSVFLNNTTPKSLGINQFGDILLITTARDTAAIAPYIQWKREKGFNVERQVVATGTNVKSLIQQRYTANNNILYAVLVGDWDDIKSDVGSQSGPMDPQLGCVVGTDDVADIIIGRISAGSSTDVTNQINKFISYEKTPDNNATWYSAALGIASDEGGSGSGDDTEADTTHQRIIYENKLSQYTYTQDNRIYDPGATASQVSTVVNSGVSIINYSGHGSMDAWGSSYFSNNNISNLTNGSKTPFIISVACNNGDFHQGTCFAEAWLRKSNGGAIAMLAASISQPWDPPMRGQDYFNDILTGGYNYSNYTSQSGINTTEGRSIYGSIVFNALTLMTTESNGSSDWETVKAWNIFGDPTIQVRTKSPDTLILSNSNIITGVNFTTIVTVSGVPTEGAQVCISQGGQYFSAISDASGQVNIPHTFSNGNVKLVVTAHNATTIYVSSAVIQTNGPYIIMESKSIDDSNANNNQLLDFSETAFLNIDARNVGLQNTTGVNATITSTDSYITINNGSHTYGNIDSNTTVTGSNAFSISLANNVPDQHIISFDLNFVDDSLETWNSPIFIVANAPIIDLESMSFSNESITADGRLEVGETADITILIKNKGHALSLAGNAVISTLSTDLVINNASQTLAALAPNATVSINFNVTANSNVDLGTPAMVTCDITSGMYNFNNDFDFIIGEIPEYRMANNIIETCVGKFFDTGGESGDYQNNESFTITFKPSTAGAVVKMDFTSFDTENGYDYMYIYDGNSTNSTQIGVDYTGTNSPGLVEATNADGMLTIKFTSDYMAKSTGWSADISCGIPSSINEIEEEFSIYPNPATNKVNIKTLNDGEFEILNIAGAIVKKDLLERGNNSINIEELKAGAYIIRIRNSNKASAYKLIVQ